MNPVFVMLIVMVGIFSLIRIMPFIVIFRPWLKALASGAPVTIFTIIGMRLRGNPPMLLIDAYIAIRTGGGTSPMAVVETVFMANRSKVRDADTLVRLVREHEQKNKAENQGYADR